MRMIGCAVAVLCSGLATAELELTFGAVTEGESPIPVTGVRLGGERLATIAVVGANPAEARMSDGGEGAALGLIGHDPVTRLTILQEAGAKDGTSAPPRGESLSLKPGDAIYLSADAASAPSRVVKWETSYQGKVLPVALIRVHHAGTTPPRPGAPLFNKEGQLVAICHQPAPQFGNGTFALPVEVIDRVESDLKSRGQVSSCWIGVTVNASNPVLAIEMVRPGSPGAKAGLRKGDILLTIGPREVRTYAEARNAFYYLVSGEATPLSVLRGTQRLTLKVVPEIHPTLEGSEKEAE